MTRRLVILRHGRTAWNAERRIQGQLDVELDEVGIEQARAVAPLVAAMEPTLLWSSDLARARMTAETVAKEAGLEPTYDARLREFRLGEYQGRTHAEIEAADPAAFELFQHGEWDDIPGGETAAEVSDRFAAVLTDLVAALGPGETGVAVSHGAATRSGVVTFLGWPATMARDLRALGNCGRVVLEERAAGEWALAAYNL